MKPQRNETLEAAIIANPDDDAAFLVYADWLLARGDPRGELITLQHATRGEEEAVRLRHQRAWLDVGDAFDRVTLTWRWGFIHTAVLRHPLQPGELLLRQLVARILQAPIAIAIRALALSGSPAQVAAAIPMPPPPTLQSLSMTVMGPRHPDMHRIIELHKQYEARGITVHRQRRDEFPRH